MGDICDFYAFENFSRLCKSGLSALVYFFHTKKNRRRINPDRKTVRIVETHKFAFAERQIVLLI